MDISPPLLSPTSPPPPKRTGWVVYAVCLTILLFVSLLANLVLLGFALRGGDGKLGLHRSRLQEELIDGDTHSRNKIAVIYLTGLISSTGDGNYPDEGMVGEIRAQLHEAAADPNVKAILLRINSPGGEVVASDAIYNAVVEVRDSGKPVVAWMESVAASGAYYVAVGADHIMATDMTITGSIGVIMQTLSFGGLMEKIGIQAHTFRSGKYKDLLNPTREPTEEEKALVQGLIMEVYDKFAGIVAAERDLDLDELKANLADGRIFSGRQAEAAGLIDGLGYFDDAVAKAQELAGIEDAQLIRYLLPFNFRNLFRFGGAARPVKFEVQLSPHDLRLEPGKLFFLPAYLFH